MTETTPCVVVLRNGQTIYAAGFFRCANRTVCYATDGRVELSNDDILAIAY